MVARESFGLGKVFIYSAVTGGVAAALAVMFGIGNFVSGILEGQSGDWVASPFVEILIAMPTLVVVSAGAFVVLFGLRVLVNWSASALDWGAYAAIVSLVLMNASWVVFVWQMALRLELPLEVIPFGAYVRKSLVVSALLSLGVGTMVLLLRRRRVPRLTALVIMIAMLIPMVIGQANSYLQDKQWRETRNSAYLDALESSDFSYCYRLGFSLSASRDQRVGWCEVKILETSWIADESVCEKVKHVRRDHCQDIINSKRNISLI